MTDPADAAPAEASGIELSVEHLPGEVSLTIEQDHPTEPDHVLTSRVVLTPEDAELLAVHLAAAAAAAR